MHDFILKALLEMAKTYTEEQVGLQVLLWQERAELTNDDIKAIIDKQHEAERRRQAEPWNY